MSSGDQPVRLVDRDSWIVAAVLMLLLTSGVVSPREPTHWMALGLVWALSHAALKPEAFRRRFVPGASPRALAGIRIWVCLALFVCVFRSDLGSTARLPREMLAVSPDRLEFLFRVPGFTGFLVDEAALAALRLFVLAVLALAAAGLFTRLTVALSAVCFFFYVAIFINYTYFFHQWLIGAYVLTAAAFTPCGDALSLDAWLRTRAGKPPVARPPQAYAWGRYLCWTVLALPYFFAGLSKLRNGGWMWWAPDNLRGKVYRDALQKGVLEPALGLQFFDMPDWIFGAIGVSTLVLEAGFFLVLFSPLARRILPLCAAAMHVGIFVLQNFVFVDALLMQAIFFQRSQPGDSPRSGTADGAAARPWASRVSYAALAIGLVWLLQIESYPLSSWGMYSGSRSGGAVVYHRTWADHETLGRIPGPYERCFPAPAFNPYVRMEGYAFEDPASQQASRKFFVACAEELNRGKPPGERITSFRMERWLWDPKTEPRYGTLLEARDVRVAPTAGRAGMPLLN